MHFTKLMLAGFLAGGLWTVTAQTGHANQMVTHVPASLRGTFVTTYTPVGHTAYRRTQLIVTAQRMTFKLRDYDRHKHLTHSHRTYGVVTDFMYQSAKGHDYFVIGKGLHHQHATVKYYRLHPYKTRHNRQAVVAYALKANDQTIKIGHFYQK